MPDDIPQLSEAEATDAIRVRQRKNQHWTRNSIDPSQQSGSIDKGNKGQGDEKEDDDADEEDAGDVGHREGRNGKNNFR